MPPPRKRPRTKVILDIKNLKLDDIMCPVCRSVIIEPVSLPCDHSLCYFCFDKSIESNTLTCPVCRKRIGGWLRTATKSKSLINQQFWSEIQKQFSKEVKCKQAGEDDGVEENVMGCKVASISNPGEIGQEFKEQLQQFSVQEREEREKQEKASAELAKKLMEEELKAKAEWLSSQQKVVEKDAELAKSLALEENKEKILESGSTIFPNESTSKDLNVIDGPSSSNGANKPKSSSSTTSSNSSRCNSIDEEFRHFTPIIPNRTSKNKPQKSGPPTISSCSQFFKNVEMVRPIKPDSTHLPETAFEKPQGPHRLHVLKQDNVDKSNAFLRVGRKSQEDHDSSDTDFEEEDDDVTKMTADGIKMATEGSKMDAPGFKMVTEGSKMVTEGSKMVTEGSKIVTEESKMDVEGTKVVHNVVADTLNMATDGTTMTLNGFKMAAAEETTDDCSKMVAQGSKMADDCSKMVTQGSKMAVEGSKMADDCSKMVAQGSKMAVEGSKMADDCSKMVAQGSKMAVEGSKMADDCSRMVAQGSKMAVEVEGFQMADDCSKMVAQGSKMAVEGSKMAGDCSKMVTQVSNMASLGKSIFADESDDVTTVCRAPITSDMETTSAVVKSVLFDEVSVISQVTAQVGDVEKIYSELEKMTMERIRQEEEDRKFALQMQEMWEKDELQRARHVTSDYKLRRKEPVTAKRTATPKGTVPRQTTLDKHVQQVRS